MSIFQLPLTNAPQQFQITLAGKEYVLTCRWNDSLEGGWVLDFNDGNTGASIVSNLPIITGGDILEGLEYLDFKGSLFVFTDGDDFAVPKLDNLGAESNVYFLTEVA